jgi:succinoglycan biosynthesis transport protein ExoP
LVTFVLVGAAVGFSLAQTPVYEASVKILVGQEPATPGTEIPREDATNLQKLTLTIAEGVKSSTVAEGVIQELGLQMSPGELLANVSAQQVGETQFIQVTYRDSSPEMTQQVANTIGDVFSEQIPQMSVSASPLTGQVWERAETPGAPVSPHLLRNALLALGLGLMLGTGLVFLLEYLDYIRRSPKETLS